MSTRKQVTHVLRWLRAAELGLWEVQMKWRSWGLLGLGVSAAGGAALFALLSVDRIVGIQAQAQGVANGRVPTIEEYQPKSTLVIPEHKIDRAKYPFVDIHSHHWSPTAEHVDQVVKEMDAINLRVLVNLSGGTGDSLKKTLAVMKGRYPNRFVVFANLSYDDLNTPGYGKRAAARLE